MSAIIYGGHLLHYLITLNEQENHCRVYSLQGKTDTTLFEFSSTSEF